MYSNIKVMRRRAHHRGRDRARENRAHHRASSGLSLSPPPLFFH